MPRSFETEFDNLLFIAVLHLSVIAGRRAKGSQKPPEYHAVAKICELNHR
jgi:hypothetical protein